MRKAFRAGLTAIAVFLVLAGSAPAFPGGGENPDETISTEVFRLVERFYIEPDRSEPLKVIESAFRQFETHHPEVMLAADEEGATAKVTVDGSELVLPLPLKGPPVEVALFFDRIVDFAAQHLPPPSDRDELRYELLRGGLRALDPHSKLLSPRAVGDFSARTKGSFGGVGFTISGRSGSIVVKKVIPDTPASRIGLMAEDVILAVDGAPTEGMGTRDVVGLVRGDVGTEVTLTVAREEWDSPRDLTAERGVIRMKSVESSILKESGAKVLHISVSRFQAGTAVEVREALNTGETEEVDGVVLDLRNNPGGLLSAAVSIADTFLDEGFIVATKKRAGVKNVTRASMFGVVRDRRPLIVLVNSRSASASEVVAAALMERRALVIGERTFGKGSVQEFKPLKDGGGLLLSTSHYLTPGFVSIQSVGVEPDIVLSPVIVGDGMRLDAVEGFMSESRFENAFSPKSAGEGQPSGKARRLDYYREDGATGKVPTGMAHPPMTVKPGGDDFALDLALRIFAAAGGVEQTTVKSGLLAAALTVLDEVKTGEGKKIERAFEELGISWSPAPGQQATAELQAFPPKGVTLQAGETVPLDFRVRNSGSEKAYRVWGRTTSDYPPLDNLDLAFGTLEPGEGRSATVQVAVPPSARERWDDFAFQLYTAASAEGPVVRALAHTSAPDSPDLAYSFSISTEGPDDRPGPAGPRLEAGGSLQLHLRLNDRRGVPLSGVEVKIGGTAADGIAVAERTRSIAELEKGGGTVTFDIQVRDDLDGEEVRIPLSVAARDYGVLLNDSIAVAVGEKITAAGDRFPPRLSLGDAAGRTDRDSISLAVSAVDDEEMKDIYAYLGGRKIFYSRNDGGGKEFNATIDVTLEEGSNRIIVFARDQNDVISQRSLFVFRSRQAEASGTGPL